MALRSGAQTSVLAVDDREAWRAHNADARVRGRARRAAAVDSRRHHHGAGARRCCCCKSAPGRGARLRFGTQLGAWEPVGATNTVDAPCTADTAAKTAMITPARHMAGCSPTGDNVQFCVGAPRCPLKFRQVH